MHFPDGYPWLTLSATLPCGARTFLTRIPYGVTARGRLAKLPNYFTTKRGICQSKKENERKNINITEHVYKSKKLCYNEYAKQIEYMIYGNILPFWAYYTLFSTYTVFEFGKNANSPNSICEAYSHIYFDLFGDNWSLRFSVRWLRLAHFLFSPIEKKDRRKKK